MTTTMMMMMMHLGAVVARARFNLLYISQSPAAYLTNEPRPTADKRQASERPMT